MKIYGASGHGKVIAEIAELLGEKQYSFIDDREIAFFFKKQVYKRSGVTSEDKLIIGIGNNKTRKTVVEGLNSGVYLTLVHPDSTISSTSEIGKGTVVMAGTRVNADTKIGAHVILNTNCSVDHDCIINDYVHISPGANVAGNVEVGEGSQIGIGASVIQGIKIGQWVTVGAGAVIIKDVPDFAVVVGIPGKIIKFKDGEI